MKKLVLLTTIFATGICTLFQKSAHAATEDLYRLEESSPDNYHLLIPQSEENGNLINKYYKVNLNTDHFTSSPVISWQGLDKEPENKKNVFQLQLPNDKVKYFKYTANPQPGEPVFNTPQKNLNGNVSGHFADSYGQTNGGAIHNALNDTINSINANFINNHSDYGGAIYNNGNIGLITADFIGNNTQTHVPYPEVSDGISSSTGGAIHNSTEGGDAKIKGINGNFIGNHVINPMNLTFGGAIANSSDLKNSAIIGDINGNFIGNYLSSDRDVHGGAIYNAQSQMGNITGNFIGNYAIAVDLHAQGGAIYNSPYERGKPMNPEDSVVGNVTGNFIGNYVRSIGDYSLGGAILNFGRMGKITGDFLGNHAEGLDLDAEGGALFNQGIINGVEGDFIGNYVLADGSGPYSLGGAIANSHTLGTVKGSFINNFVEILSNDRQPAYGGGIFTTKGIHFATDGQTRFISGNYTKDQVRGKIFNGLFVSPRTSSAYPEITFDTSNGGAWIINDNIEGGRNNYGSTIAYAYQYDLLFKGNDSVNPETNMTEQYISVNNDIINARNITIEGTTLRFGTYEHEDKSANNWNGQGRFIASLNLNGTPNDNAPSVTGLTLKNNGVFHIANGYRETIRLNNLSSENGFVHIDVNPDEMTSDVLNINGDVKGVTNLIVHATSDTDIRNRGSILFAQSTNDTTGNSGSFVVSRVYNSPYLYNIAFDRVRANEPNAHTWEFAMNDTINPDPEEPETPIDPVVPNPVIPTIPENPQVVPEIPAYQGLPSAALEQTRSMVQNIAGQVRKVRADYNLWANAALFTSKYDQPINMDSDIWGLEAGADLLHEPTYKLGIFASYRDGRYDLNGHGKNYFSPIGSKIDIDSYIGGLYYRFDKNRWWAFATLYGGVQKADLKTDDGIKTNTDGTQFGGSLEAGYDYALQPDILLTPTLGAFYTQVNFDNITDVAGKTAQYDNLNQVELEAGLKLSKLFKSLSEPTSIYIKPSIVQSIVNGDQVRITGLNKTDVVDDQTLGRMELGGQYYFTPRFSGYGWVNYTFGKDYHAGVLGIGLNYAL